MEAQTLKEEHPATWHSHEFRAMGSTIAVWLETDDADTAAIAFEQVNDLFDSYERSLSRFRPDSELSRLNAQTGQWVVVSGLMWNLLTLALEMAAVTDGYFDPTMLNALVRAGYTASFEQLGLVGGHVPLLQETAQPGNWTAVRRDGDRQAIYLPEGLGVDLGGIAKGYAAQQAVDLIRPYGGCLVDAGGDLAAGDAPRGYPGWPVAISSPWAADAGETIDLCRLWLANQALTSSGRDYRTWEIEGQRMHHLIDPSTRMPAGTDCLTATVLADDAAQAEAWATAALVAGSVSGMKALLRAQLAGLMVTQSGNIQLTPRMSQVLQLTQKSRPGQL